MRLVMSGNFKEFQREFGGDSDYKYLSHLPESLYGYQNTELVLYGTFYLRSDFDRKLVESYCAIHNIKII